MSIRMVKLITISCGMPCGNGDQGLTATLLHWTVTYGFPQGCSDSCFGTSVLRRGIAATATAPAVAGGGGYGDKGEEVRIVVLIVRVRETTRGFLRERRGDASPLLFHVGNPAG